MIIFNAVVSARIDITPELCILQIKPHKWKLPPFRPGQFCVLGLTGEAPRVPESDPEEKPPEPRKWIQRAYSIASSSVEKEYIEVYLSLVRSGALTPRLFALKPGDLLYLAPKFTGIFTFDQVPLNQNIVMIATGTGLAPYMSMIRTFLKTQSQRHFAIIHGARHSWDLGYFSELNRLASEHDHFHYFPVISQAKKEAAAWHHAKGHVQNVWKSSALQKVWPTEISPQNTHFFLCGNPQMVEEMTEALTQAGFREHHPRRPGQIHSERYW